METAFDNLSSNEIEAAIMQVHREQGYLVIWSLYPMQVGRVLGPSWYPHIGNTQPFAVLQPTDRADANQQWERFKRIYGQEWKPPEDDGYFYRVVTD